MNKRGKWVYSGEPYIDVTGDTNYEDDVANPIEREQYKKNLYDGTNPKGQKMQTSRPVVEKYNDDFMSQYNLDWTPFSLLYTEDPYYSQIREHELATSKGKEGTYATNAEGRYVPVSELNKLWNDYLLTQPQVNNAEELEVSKAQQHRQNQEFNRQVDNFFMSNWLRPSQIVGALDPGGDNGDVPFAQRLLLGIGNTGLFSHKAAQEHPYLAEALNMAFDFMAPGPIGKIGPSVKGLTNVATDASNWRPWVPNNANRFYRIVGSTGNPIEDAIKSGVIMGTGANPDARSALSAANKTKGNITLVGKAHSYPMFSKGRIWEGGTSRAAGERGKPTVIRSKSDTGPIVWEQSNVDFRHKGHEGIFRPSYYGDVNASPIQFFEYWEPKRFGYMRKDFPMSNNPWSNFMGSGYSVDRGGWESGLGITGERFGKYIGSGGEQTVFEDLTHPDQVLKVYDDTYRKTLDETKELVSDLARRNSVPLQEPIEFVGLVDHKGYPYPVFSQKKLKPLGSMSTEEFTRTYLPTIRENLLPFGYIDDGISSRFTDGIRTLVDLKPENMGLTSDGRLRFFDVDYIER